MTHLFRNYLTALLLGLYLGGCSDHSGNTEAPDPGETTVKTPTVENSSPASTHEAGVQAGPGREESPSEQAPATGFSTTGQSSYTEAVDDIGPYYTIVDTDFSLVNWYRPQSKTFVPVLTSTTVESLYRPGMEGAQSRLTATAWVSGKADYDTQLWVIKDDSDQGGRRSDFYLSEKFGCCGAEDTSRAYNIETGKYIFSFTVPPVKANIPNTDVTRFITYLSSQASADYPRGTSNNTIGIVSICSDTAVLDQIEMINPDQELAWSPGVELISDKEPNGTKKLDLWHLEGNSQATTTSGYSIKLIFYEGMESILPVSNDQVDISGATLPSGMTLRRIKPAPPPEEKKGSLP